MIRRGSRTRSASRLAGPVVWGESTRSAALTVSDEKLSMFIMMFLASDTDFGTSDEAGSQSGLDCSTSRPEGIMR